MIINTQDQVLTIAMPWWDTIGINPEGKLEVLLLNAESEETLRLAKFRSQKKATALLEAVLGAIRDDDPRFDVNLWVIENYSE